MPMIYHLLPPADWDTTAATYAAASLKTEGFIHLSHARQVARSANKYYANAIELLLLCVDTTRLRHPLREEAATNGELFPHLYGALNRDAVVEVRQLTRDAGGAWVFAL